MLAYHYSHSADPSRAIPYLVVAGDRAKDRYANEEAIAAFCQAVSLIEHTGGYDGSIWLRPDGFTWPRLVCEISDGILISA